MTPEALTDMIREAMRARMIANRTTFARAEAMGPPGTLGSGYVVHKALPPRELDDVLQDIAAGVAVVVTFSNAVGDDVPIEIRKQFPDATPEEVAALIVAAVEFLPES